MTVPTPAATARLLLDAADRLEELAPNVTAGTWVADAEGFVWSVVGDEVPTVVAELPGVGDLDAVWIAILSPAVAAPLAAWLREEHEFCFQRAPGDEWTPSESAVEFARRVVGSEVPPATDAPGALQRLREAPYAAQDAPGVLPGGSADSEPGNPSASAGGPA